LGKLSLDTREFWPEAQLRGACHAACVSGLDGAGNDDMRKQRGFVIRASLTICQQIVMFWMKLPHKPQMH